MSIFSRVKSDLEWRAGDEISSGITKGVRKVFKKGEKNTKCPKCKTPITPDLKFCPKCGAKLVVTCPKCNVDYPIGTKFCPKCGEKLK